MQPGRNDPCPCGSGKKYKKCCENEAVRSPVPPEVARANALKEADRQLTERLLRFSRMRLGSDWLQLALSAYTGGEDEALADDELQLAAPWALFHFPITGGNAPIARIFREETAGKLTSDLLEALDAQLVAWLGVWEVRRVEQGVGVSVTDLLTGEVRFVRDISTSTALNPRDALLALVVDSGDVSFFGGIHPHSLGPRDADLVVRQIRRLCRVRTRPVKIDRLRELGVQLSLIYLWRELVARSRARGAPKLTNTDGDLLVLTTDHFDILAPDVSTLLSCFVTLPGAEEPLVDEGDADATVITITKPGNARIKSWDNTVIGRIVVKRNRMMVESNSTRRADDLRSLLDAHLGELVRHRLREETSQMELLRRGAEGTSRPGSNTLPGNSREFASIAKDFRERHMLAWLDDEIPALGDLTPREAAKSPRSRKSLELLLREFENHEARLPENERFDVNRLRIELDMTDE